MNFSVWAIRRPLPALLLFAALTVLGWLGFRALAIQNIPEFDFPTVTVSVGWPGVGAESIEREITRPLEDALASLEQVERISSQVVEGQSRTTVEFDFGKPTAEAVEEVRDAVNRLRAVFPADATQPQVNKVTIGSAAVLTVAVGGESKTLAELSGYVDDVVVKRLSGLRGVARVEREGGVQAAVNIELQPAQLHAFGLSASDVARQLKSQLQDGAAGLAQVRGAQQTIRAAGALRELQQLHEVELALPSGGFVRLPQIARIALDSDEPVQQAYFNGKEVVAFSVFAARGADTIGVVQAVRQALQEMAAAQPSYTFVEVRERISNIERDYRESMKVLYEGAVLTMLVVWFFLRSWRSTMVAAVALPLSIIPTFAFMHWLGYSLNGITLLALTLVIGILVDDAIVEVENIERHRQMGKPAVQAASDAATEIGLAVVATSLTLVAVFLPTAFMPGVPGKFFQQFGWTASIAVLVSLAVARLLTPMMAAYWLKSSHTPAAIQPRWMPLYERWLQAALQRPLMTLLSTLVFFVASLALLMMLSTSFIPPSQDGRVNVELELGADAPLAQASLKAEQAYALLRNHAAVQSVYAVARAGSATLSVRLTEEARQNQGAAQASLSKILHQLSGVKVALGQEGGSARYSLVLMADNPTALQQAAQDIEAQMRELPGYGSVRSSATTLKPEVLIELDDKRAAELGVTAGAVAHLVRVATTGDYDLQLPRLEMPSRSVPIRVRMPTALRQDLQALGELRIRTAQGLVPLSSVATLKLNDAPASIERRDRQRFVTLSMELGERTLGDAARDVAQLPAVQKLPAGVRMLPAGDFERMAELFSSFGWAMLAGVASVYMVLVLLFHGFLQPLTILTALPLAVGGALAALVLTNQPLSLASLIGLLMLMGVVTKNSILLVENAARWQREGHTPRQAIEHAAKQRARPILMTSVAMIAGMLPIALASESSFRVPMAAVVIGGLMTSTLLSLLVVPVVYERLETVRLKVLKKSS